MKKQRPKQQQNRKGHGIRVRCLGFVDLAPSRKSMIPFCAYYGPNGETCSETRMLASVWTMPPCTYMACPLHYDDVQQQVQRFLASLEKLARHV